MAGSQLPDDQDDHLSCGVLAHLLRTQNALQSTLPHQQGARASSLPTTCHVARQRNPRPAATLSVHLVDTCRLRTARSCADEQFRTIAGFLLADDAEYARRVDMDRKERIAELDRKGIPHCPVGELFLFVLFVVGMLRQVFACVHSYFHYFRVCSCQI